MKPKTKNCNYIVLYGTLMRGYDNYDKFNLSNRLSYIKKTKFNGIMYDIGGYPGVIVEEDNNRIIEGELYYIRDQSLLPKLDDFESYYPENTKNSLYIRELIELESPKSIKAWIYLYNKSVNDKDVVKSNNWNMYNNES